MTRSELDRRMREVLAQLEICSHVPAAGWGQTGQSRSSDEPLGGQRPPGDLGHVMFARRYGRPFYTPSPSHRGCVSDAEREEVLRSAELELEQLRGRGPRERPVGETSADRDKRMLEVGEGFTAREVAVRFRCGERDVRRVRLAAGLEPDYGRAPERDADAQHRRDRAQALAESNCSIAQIARLLGASRSTIERDLGRRPSERAERPASSGAQRRRG